MNEQDKAAMEKAWDETPMEQSPYGDFVAGFTSAIEYRDSLTCEYALDSDGEWMESECGESFRFGGREYDLVSAYPYCLNCGRRMVTK